jgi:hypothetical protein
LGLTAAKSWEVGKPKKWLTVPESGFDELFADVGVGKWKRTAGFVYFFAAKSPRMIENLPSDFVSYSSGINHWQEAFPTPTQ